LTARDKQVFQSEIGKMETQQQEKVMEIVTSWMEQGIEREARSLILRLLTRRVGTLSTEIRSRVEALPLPQLELLGEALLDFVAIADLETWLHHHEP
jgi:Domain of unknown function (DUF4351)